MLYSTIEMLAEAGIAIPRAVGGKAVGKRGKSPKQKKQALVAPWVSKTSTKTVIVVVFRESKGCMHKRCYHEAKGAKGFRRL